MRTLCYVIRNVVRLIRFTQDESAKNRKAWYASDLSKSDQYELELKQEMGTIAHEDKKIFDPLAFKARKDFKSRSLPEHIVRIVTKKLSERNEEDISVRYSFR